MRFARVAIHVEDEATLKTVVAAWSAALQEGLKAKHGGRFQIQWTFSWGNNEDGADTAIRGYHEQIALTENGLPYARIMMNCPAEQPRMLDCELESDQPPFRVASKLMGALALVIALAAFCAWAYYLFFGGGWARAVERLAHAGPCDECASKLELAYLFVAGWLVVPVMCAFPITLLGDWLDGVIGELPRQRAWRRIEKELLPGLELAVRDIQMAAVLDPKFGMRDA